MKIISIVLYVAVVATMHSRISPDAFFIGTCAFIAGLSVDAGLFINGERIETDHKTPKIS